MIDLSKLTYNKKILSGVVILSYNKVLLYIYIYIYICNISCCEQKIGLKILY